MKSLSTKKQPSDMLPNNRKRLRIQAKYKLSAAAVPNAKSIRYSGEPCACNLTGRSAGKKLSRDPPRREHLCKSGAARTSSSFSHIDYVVAHLSPCGLQVRDQMAPKQSFSQIYELPQGQICQRRLDVGSTMLLSQHQYSNHGYIHRESRA